MFSKRKFYLYYNILLASISLIVIGTSFVLSSTIYYGVERHNPYLYFIRHIFYLLIGIIILLIIRKIKIEVFEKVSFFLFLISLLLLPLPVLQGNLRWIKIGPFSVQPSEFVKLTFIIYMAKYFKNRYTEINKLKTLFIPISFFLIITGLLQLQKDLGNTFIIFVVFLSILILCGFKWKYTFGLIIFSIFLFGILIILCPYRIERIMLHLNPTKDPHGRSYQIIQAKITLSSGGLIGKGPGGGTGKLKFLPEAHKDFVYAVVGEETGFIGTTFVLVLFGIVVFSGLEISKYCKNMFEKILVASLSTLLGVQFLLHAGVVVSILPPKGTTMPFFSFGGSSLLVNIISVGIIIKIAKDILTDLDLEDIKDNF